MDNDSLSKLSFRNIYAGTETDFIAFSLTLNAHSIVYNTQIFATHLKGKV